MATYTAKTRIGNYFEDLELEEAKMKAFLEKKAQGNLAVTAMNKKLREALTPVDLSQRSPDGYLHFGDVVTLTNMDNNSSLAITLEDQIGSRDDPLWQLTASQDNNPYTRSTWVLTRPREDDNDTNDDVLHYGQFVSFTTHPDLYNKRLYLWSSVKSQLHSSKMTGNQLVAAADEPTWRSVWKIVPADPTDRVMLDGDPVPIGARVLITHCATNANLNSDEVPVRNMFGIEFEVCGVTKRDHHKVEKPENQWYIVTGDQ